jgi:hypothetical protein
VQCTKFAIIVRHVITQIIVRGFLMKSCIVYKVQRTSAGLFIGLILQNGGDPIPKCIAPKSPLGALHLEMHQKTDILEEVPIYHKTRSAMHLFLTPHQMCNALLVSGGSLVISLFQVSSPSLSASHHNPAWCVVVCPFGYT